MARTDEQLLRNAVAGDEASLAALLEEYGVKVRAALDRSYRRRLKGEVDLDDVMQVTYLEAFLRIRDFVPAGLNAFHAWLGRIAENNLRDAIRKSDTLDRRRVSGQASAWEESYRTLLEPIARTSSPSRSARRDELRQVLDTALQQLPEDYERVLRLYDIEGHSGPEVARLLGRSHGAVKMLVARARDRLCELLGSETGFLSSDQ